MSLTEHKIKDSTNENLMEFKFLKVSRIRKTFLNYLGWFVVLAIIGQFATYGFGLGLLYALYLLIFWFIASLIINWIFNPIITRIYLKEFGATQEEIDIFSYRRLIQRIPFKRSWINPIILLSGSVTILITILNYMDFSSHVYGRFASLIIQEHFNNTILVIISIIVIMGIILYFNRKKK